MSAVLYRLAAKTARDMIRKFGGPVTLLMPQDESFDPVAGSVTSGTPLERRGKGLLTGYKDNLVDGTVIQRGDRRLLLEAGMAPTRTTKIRIGSEIWKVVDVDTIAPGQVTVLYTVQVRR